MRHRIVFVGIILLIFLLIYAGKIFQDNNITETSEPNKIIDIYYSIEKMDKLFILSRSKPDLGIELPESGKVFLVIQMTIHNKGYDEFSTNLHYFKVIVDNIGYNIAFEEYSIDAWETVEILDGGNFEGTLIFEVPETSSPLTLDYHRPFKNYDIVWNDIEK